MALRDLSTSAMISLGNRCTLPAPQGIRGLLEQDAMLNVYPARIAAVTAPLVSMEATLGAIQGEIGVLTRQITDEDAEGDALIGGFDDLLSGAAAVCSNEALRASIVSAREAALGSGGRARLVRASYVALSGEAAQMEHRLQPDHWATLDQIRVADLTAADVLRRWLVLARSISQRDIQRSELRTRQDDSNISRSEVATARNQWMRVMKSFVGAVDISDLSEADRALILNPIHEAEQKAAQSRLRKATPPVTSTEAAPPATDISSPQS